MNRRELLTTAGIGTAAAFSVLAASRGHAQTSSTSVNVLIVYHSVSGNTAKMAQGVADGANAVLGASVILKRVDEITADDLLAADAVIVGSPVYFGTMSGEVKSFFDNWLLKFGVFREFKMRNKVGGAFSTGAGLSNGKEATTLAILGAMLVNQMIIVGGGGAFGASATTGAESPGIDEKELIAARDLGKRVAELTVVFKRRLQ